MADREDLNRLVAEEERAQARAAELGEALGGHLILDVARQLAALPEGAEREAHLRFVRSKLCTGALVRQDRSLTIRELGDQFDFPAESSPIPLDEAARGRATDSLLTTLDLADQIARRLDLPRVRIRIANARKAVPR